MAKFNSAWLLGRQVRQHVKTSSRAGAGHHDPTTRAETAQRLTKVAIIAGIINIAAGFCPSPWQRVPCFAQVPVTFATGLLSESESWFTDAKEQAWLSVDNKQLRADPGERTVRFGIVRNLIAHAWFERKPPAILQLSFELALNTEEYVALGAPMIREIARGVLNHPNADAAKIASAPIGHATLALVFGLFNLRPVRDCQGDARNFHK
jgi:hypothetical protein